MPPSEFQVPLAFDYFATFLWALSGAFVAMHKRYDLSGMLVIAVLASTGGSLIRDGIFLQRTPPVLTDGWYLPIIVVATLVASLFRYHVTHVRVIDPLIDVIDALGVPAFAVVGMQLSLQAGIPIPGAALVGVVNGFGGGLLRDIVVGDSPSILRPGRLAISILIFLCVLFLLLVRWVGLSKNIAAWGMIFLYFAIRMMSMRFNWQTRPVLSDEPAVEQTDDGTRRKE